MKIRDISQHSKAFFRIIIHNIILVFLFLFITSFDCAAQKKPNIIFINFDDLSIAFDAYRNSYAPTPNIERLAQHGVIFKNVYAQYSLCSPSRTSIFSGKRAKTTKITDNIEPMRTYMDTGYHFINEYFHDYGYRTECYGKFTCTHESELKWDKYYNASGNGDGDFLNNNDDESNSINKATSIKSSIQEPIWYIDTVSKFLNSTEDGKETVRFLNAIDTMKSRPYFINLGLQVHNPFTPLLQFWNRVGTPDYNELLPVDTNFVYTNIYGNGSANIPLPDSPPDDTVDIPEIALKPSFKYSDSEVQRIRHAYYSEIAQADSLIGNVLNKLDKKKLWDSSVVVFWSDHGLSLGEHDGQWLKINMFEEGLRVPMIICAPGRLKGVQCDKLVELVDIFQTLTELCGLPPQGNQEGASLVPLLDNPDLPWKRAIFSNLKRSILKDTLIGTAVRTNSWHYNNWQEAGEELYKITVDSTEINNLAYNPEYIDTLNKMRTLAANDWQGVLPPVYKSQIFYKDNDGDGYGNTADTIRAYALLPGYRIKKGDCDDNNPNAYPDAPENACNGIDDNCNLKIDENKPVPIIVANGSLDICGTGKVLLTTNSGQSFSYQWQRNFLDIPGATKKSYKATDFGTYVVKITHRNGCANFSKGVVVYSGCAPYSSLGNNNIVIDQYFTDLSIYPNPSKGKFVVNFYSNFSGKVNLKVCNSIGQNIINNEFYAIVGKNVYNIELPKTASGIYEVWIGKNHKSILIE